MKTPSTQTLKKNLWKIFSKYIRKRDGGVCISCGKQGEISEMEAGHYHPRTAGLSTFFDERNVNCQCNSCNYYQHGNLTAYAIALRKKYGEGILEELDQLRRTPIKIYAHEYLALIEKYKALIKELEG